MLTNMLQNPIRKRQRTIILETLQYTSGRHILQTGKELVQTLVGSCPSHKCLNVARIMFQRQRTIVPHRRPFLQLLVGRRTVLVESS